ncbi:MAG: glucosyl transferase, partial [Fidelibacterota bacterium]
TMDTTRHDFQWEVIEFPSPFGSGALYDVAIIDENDIWAVGEIYADSAQPWLPYNAVHWDGEKWELKKVPYYDETGYAWYTPIKSILAFSAEDIWFEAGIHWNGIEFESRPLNIDFPSHVNKMWGTSSDDLYIVGNNGLIAHYDGQGWQRMESGTELDFRDIWGTVNPNTGKIQFMAIASAGFSPPPDIYLLFYDGQFHTITKDGLPGVLVSGWFIPDRKYFVVRDGVFYTYQLGKVWQADTIHPLLFKAAIRGTNLNDIIITGGFGLVSHFNGVSWRHYAGNELPSFYGTYGSVDYNGTLLIAVGDIGDRAIVLRGIKQSP